MPPLVRMIAQAHLDPVWLWRWTEGRAEALATSRSAVDRLREYPALHFVRGEAQVYQWIEEESPGLFAEIKEMIRAGRWHVVNGMIVQPDMNLPQGESLVRQALLGKRYLQEKLGVDVHIAYCVDSFGHAGTLPQILKKCGFDAYVFMRPQAHEKALPAQAFWWEAPDGSRVLAFHICDSYGGPGSEAHIGRTLAEMPPQAQDTMCFFGVGNHGGGPTRAQIEEVLAIAAGRRDVEIRFDHPQAYFEAIAPAASLPVLVDELQYHATGCYSANGPLKRMHRQAECALLVAERMACLAELWAGRAADRDRLRALWHDLCFNQFHDTLAGSSIKEAADEAILALGRVTLGAREIADTAARLIGARVDTGGPGSTVLLFNPFPYRRQEYVEYEPWTDWERWPRFGWGLVDEAGRPVPHQAIQAQAGVGNAERGIERLVFRTDLPPLGYRLYRFGRGLGAGSVESSTAENADAAGCTAENAENAEGEALAAQRAEGLEGCPAITFSVVKRDPRRRALAHAEGLENDRLTVRLDPQTGAIASCRDKVTGVEFVGPGGWNVGQVLEDTSDTWSHGVRAFDKVLGCFGAPRITVGEAGPLQASLYVERTWQPLEGEAPAEPSPSLQASLYAERTWLQQLILRAGEAEILVRNWLFWQGRWRMVKLAFDVAVTEPEGWRDVPFGAFPCPGDGAEMPLQMWIDVSGLVATNPPSPLRGEGTGVRGGLALLNDSKYAGDLCGSTLRLTILRCPPYAYHVPHVMGTKQRYDWIDQGLQEFTLILRPHLGGWREAGVVRRARELNLPIQAVTMYAHSGELPAAASLATLAGDELELTALKPAEDGNGYIVRIADRHGYGGVGTLTWMGQAFSVACKSSEVVTLRLERRGGAWQASPCDMIERPI